MFFKRKEMKGKVLKSFPMLLALFSVQVLLTVEANVHKVVEGVGDDEEMKCVCDGGCEHLRESDCPWGLTLDVCGCCFLCARGENEPCAGAHGTCAIGLGCQLNPIRDMLMAKEGTCTRYNETCISPVNKFGCTVQGGKCICEERFGCPDEEMFLFDTEDSCRSQTASLIARKDLEPRLIQSVSATDECHNIQCPKTTECPPDSYRHPVVVDSNHEPCCPQPEDCLCDPGLICPSPDPCPDGWLMSIVTSHTTGKPGKCCPLYECAEINGTTGLETTVCSFNGKWYTSEEYWTHDDDCTECNCHHGVVSCKSIQCDIPDECTVVRANPGSCCPVCAGCLTNSGKVYNNSDTWEEDSCTTCECKEGRIKCHAAMCQTTCLNPKHFPGECCPHCDNEAECPFMECQLECPNGFRLSKTGCPTCKCITCRRMAYCNKECELGYETNEKGCTICRCKRKESIHVQHQSQKNEPFKHEGFELDLKCEVNSWDSSMSSHSNGEEWSDNCRRCVCKNGTEMCSLITCPPIKCQHPISFHGSCCPWCPDQDVEKIHHEKYTAISVCQSSDGIQYIDGEMWKLGDCLTCTCHNGQVLCAAPDCPPSPCSNSLIEKEGDCCLQCPKNKSRLLSDKNSFINLSNQSKLNCFSEDSQKIYADGEIWKGKACQSCICENGQVQCFSSGKCLTLECERPILAKNQCCPICLGNKSREGVVIVNDLIRKNPTSKFNPSSKRTQPTSDELLKESHPLTPLVPSHPTVDIEAKMKQNWSGLELNCVIIISVLSCVSLFLSLYIIGTYFCHRSIRQINKTILQHSTSMNSSFTPSVTPDREECCYKSLCTNCTQLSEQKTPLCHKKTSATCRNTSLILNTEKV